MSLEDDINRVLGKYGITCEPDTEITPHHRRIIGVTPISGTKSGHICSLECGHAVMMFGNLDRCGGMVLCQECKKAGEVMELGKQHRFCPNCGAHHYDGNLTMNHVKSMCCNAHCRERWEMKYARMILSKDADPGREDE